MVGAAPTAVRREGAVAAAPTQKLKIPHGQLLIVTEQHAHLLQAGMTLDEGLSILEKRLKQPRVQQMTHTLHQALIDGRSFSQALSELPRIFPPLYVNLVAAGEASGVLLAVGAVIGFRAFVRTNEGRVAWDRFRLLIPGYGRVIRHQYYAQFSRTLGTLMENGIPLLRSLDLVTEIAGNKFLELKLREVRRAVIDGATLSAALQAQKLFPDLLTDMMSVGEQTGHFAETMQAIADVYERELDRSVGVISQLIPPVIIVVIAVLVGLVVFSILSAVFEMTHSLQFRPH